MRTCVANGRIYDHGTARKISSSQDSELISVGFRSQNYDRLGGTGEFRRELPAIRSQFVPCLTEQDSAAGRFSTLFTWRLGIV